MYRLGGVRWPPGPLFLKFPSLQFPPGELISSPPPLPTPPLSPPLPPAPPSSRKSHQPNAPPAFSCALFFTAARHLHHILLAGGVAVLRGQWGQQVAAAGHSCARGAALFFLEAAPRLVDST